MTDQLPPEPEYTPRDTAALEAEIDEFLAMGLARWGLGSAAPRQALIRAIGLNIDPAANERGFTVEVGQIDPAAVPLDELVNLGPNADLLADLIDSFCATPNEAPQ